MGEAFAADLALEWAQDMGLLMLAQLRGCLEHIWTLLAGKHLLQGLWGQNGRRRWRGLDWNGRYAISHGVARALMAQQVSASLEAQTTLLTVVHPPIPMLLLMHVSGRHLIEALTACSTRVRSLACMQTLMHTQISFLVKASVADPTYIWLCCAVCELMLQQLTCKEIAFPAEATLEGAVVYVDTLMHAQVAAVAEAHPTGRHIAHKRLQFGVGSLVRVPRTALRERLLAEAALIGLLARVDSQVRAEVLPLPEALAADGALKRLVDILWGLCFPR